MQVRILKQRAGIAFTWSKGQIVTVSEEAAAILVEQGAAEYVGQIETTALEPSPERATNAAGLDTRKNSPASGRARNAGGTKGTRKGSKRGRGTGSGPE